VLFSFVSLVHPYRPEGSQHVAELQVQFPGQTGDQPIRTQQPLHDSFFLGVVSQADAPEKETRDAPPWA